MNLPEESIEGMETESRKEGWCDNCGFDWIKQYQYWKDHTVEYYINLDKKYGYAVDYKWCSDCFHRKIDSRSEGYREEYERRMEEALRHHRENTISKWPRTWTITEEEHKKSK